jgi:hypothetical protein
LSEAISFESRRHGWLFQHGVVAFLGFRRKQLKDLSSDYYFVRRPDNFGERLRVVGMELDQQKLGGQVPVRFAGV